MFWMVLGHTIKWGLTTQDAWIYEILERIFSPIGAAGFLFVSGVSISYSFKKKTDSIYGLNTQKYEILKKEYFYRAAIILIISLIYNSFALAWIFGIKYIWSWFILQTVAVSLFITWPLLKTSKVFRIGFCLMLWLLNQILFPFLSIYEGQGNLYGFLYHILYSFNDQSPILIFSTFLIIGTIIGEKLFELNSIEQPDIRIAEYKKNFGYFFITGILLILLAIYFSFSDFLLRGTASWNLYAIGIEIVVFSIFMLFEEFELISFKKNHRFLFYYSYYSLTIFLGHNVLYLIFYQQLTIITVWIATPITFILMGLLLKEIYKRWGWKASLKAIIGKISTYLAKNVNFREKFLGYMEIGLKKVYPR